MEKVVATTGYASNPRRFDFFPHPDDECIVGGLALRLARESGMKVANVAVTLGSKPARQKARLKELRSACRYLGFELIVAGLTDINVATHKRRPKEWGRAVNVIADILREKQPAVIFVPHAQDGHATHIGTCHLVMDALRQMPKDFQCHVIETEFWGQMAAPNLIVEMSAIDLADLMSALSLHKSEVKRNPYHLRLPAWMMDNVRRAELVLGPGAPAPGFAFATLYRLRQWKRGRLVETLSSGKVLSIHTNPASIIPRRRNS